jgi:hypothetical protein
MSPGPHLSPPSPRELQRGEGENSDATGEGRVLVYIQGLQGMDTVGRSRCVSAFFLKNTFPAMETVRRLSGVWWYGDGAEGAQPAAERVIRGALFSRARSAAWAGSVEGPARPAAAARDAGAETDAIG